MKSFFICFLIMICGAPLFAQRDFLTSDEVEKIREAQDPNLRIQVYIQFAKQRLDQLQQQVAKDRKGRSLIIRQLLEDYSAIIDAIDTVSDDALKRKLDITAGTAALAAAEPKFLAQLKKIEDSQPHDLDMYDVSLKDAIGSTSDSMDASKEDLGKRAEVVAAKEEKEKKEIESMTPKDEVQAQKAEDAKADVGTPKRKPPTLYRPGEKPGQPNQ